MKQPTPITKEDSQIYFVVQCYKKGLITLEEANKALQAIVKERKIYDTDQR